MAGRRPGRPWRIAVLLPVAAAALLALGLAGGSRPARAGPVAAASAVDSGSAAAASSAIGAVVGAETATFKPTDELQRLQLVGRSQPDVALPGLLHYADTLRPDDPRHLETLMELGDVHVSLADGERVEQVARRIEQLGVPLARPAAMLLRGHWLQAHDEVSRAERQFIEAAALLPADAPGYLRLRLLTSWAEVKSRGGHYDAALARYNQALKLIDDTGPPWRRIDMRGSIASVLMDANQFDKAAEFVEAMMRLATEAGDELGMSRAYTLRGFMLSRGPDSAAAVAADRTALEHARRSGNQRQVVLCMANVADYYLSHGDFQTAWDLSQRALPIARRLNSESVESLALANTGLALIGMHRKDEGLPLVHESMSMDERSGSARSISDEAYELGGYLERAGYLGDALESYRQYRRMSDELDQQDRQRALIELQEGFANENRQHELEMLSREGRLKDAEILHHELRIKLWTAAGLSSLLLAAVIATLARRLRVRNQMLSVSNEQLRQQAEIDPLTGLSNRHHLQAVMAQRPGPGLQGTLYLLDVDHFKQINDRCGHAGGDAVLIEIARRLRATLRDDDLVVRWGGEEFLVLVRPLPPAEAEALALRLLAALADAPVRHEGQPVAVSASIGYAGFPLASSAPQPELVVPWERAIALVDTAMYLAKTHGRNRACCIRRLDAPDAAALEAIVESLEKAADDGRAELRMLAGPPLRGSR
ncbi:MAG: diguanylate cyclase domain-containing protein [Burkholderiaceae bacterium]